MAGTGAKNDDFLYPVAMALVVFGLLATFAIVPRLIRPSQGRMSGSEAPDITATFVANAPEKAETFKLSDARGHAVLLDFWATWCPPCRAELPIIDRLASKYKDRGLVVVGVNTSEESGLAAPFVKRAGLSFPIAYDDGGRASHAYGVENLPTLVVISKTGKVVAVRTGVTSDADLEKLIQKAL
jgi:cytochrome c biogenesis protein CcmG/thiol:disulfide interchange protein DsbE